MSNSHELHSQPEAGELGPLMRRHLETQLAELNARHDWLVRQIAAVEADTARPVGDGVQELILRERQVELISERDRIVALLDSGLVYTGVLEWREIRLRELRQELGQQLDALSQRIASLSADEEMAAKITWPDRERELARRTARFLNEQQAVAAQIAEVKAKLGQ